LRGDWIGVRMLFRGGSSRMGEKWHLALKQMDMSEYRLEIGKIFPVVRSMGLNQ